MRNEYTAIVKEDAGWWIGWIQEIPGVNCQELFRSELLETLRITLQEALEMNRPGNSTLAVDATRNTQ